MRASAFHALPTELIEKVGAMLSTAIGSCTRLRTRRARAGNGSATVEFLVTLIDIVGRSRGVLQGDFVGNSSIRTGLIGLAVASGPSFVRPPAFGQAPAPAAPPTFAVAGNVSAPLRRTATQVTARFSAMMKPVHYTLKGVDHVADAVPLIAMVVAAQPKFDAHVKHDMLQYTVTVTGQDGYTVVSAWAN